MGKLKIILILTVLPVVALLAFPYSIGYQGKLTDPYGVAINDTVEVGFSIWNSVTAGDSLWGEIDTVQAIKGLFDAVLGDEVPITVDFSGMKWIQIIIAGEVLIPRQQLNGVPVAIYANYADSLVGGVIVDHNDMDGLQGGDVLSGEFYHLTFLEYSNLHASGSDNQNIFESITDGSATYTAASEHDAITFRGVGGAAVVVDDITGTVIIDASTSGDNWGTQVALTDATITGDGDATALSVNWGSVTQHSDVTDDGSGAIITDAERAGLHDSGSDNQNLFSNVTDGTNTYTALSQTDPITFTGSGGAVVTVDALTGEVTIDASTSGDNWGTQVVETEPTLFGEGTLISPLDINWGSVTQHLDVTDAGSGLIITGAERTQIATNATNIGDLTYTEENYVTDGEPLTASVDALDQAVADIEAGTSDSYIQNQDASAQTADFWIAGDGEIDGDLTVGNIIGQGFDHGTVSPVVSISSTSTPVILTEITYISAGPGSEIHLSFAGTFDDKGGQDGAYVNVELVRDPGTPGETTISQVSVSIYSSTVHQMQNVSINGYDVPLAGTHTYAVRAVVEKEPYTSGRCLNGVLQLAEIKE